MDNDSGFAIVALLALALIVGVLMEWHDNRRYCRNCRLVRDSRRRQANRGIEVGEPWEHGGH